MFFFPHKMSFMLSATFSFRFSGCTATKQFFFNKTPTPTKQQRELGHPKVKQKRKRGNLEADKGRIYTLFFNHNSPQLGLRFPSFENYTSQSHTVPIGMYKPRDLNWAFVLFASPQPRHFHSVLCITKCCPDSLNLSYFFPTGWWVDFHPLLFSAYLVSQVHEIGPAVQWSVYDCTRCRVVPPWCCFTGAVLYLRQTQDVLLLLLEALRDTAPPGKCTRSRRIMMCLRLKNTKWWAETSSRLLLSGGVRRRNYPAHCLHVDY